MTPGSGSQGRVPPLITPARPGSKAVQCWRQGRTVVIVRVLSCSTSPDLELWQVD